MFHNRHIWKNLIAMLEQNRTLTDTAIVNNWIIRTYVHSQCSAVRRLSDDDTKKISLCRCLHDLRKSPWLVTRSRYEDLVTAEAKARGTIDAVPGEGWRADSDAILLARLYASYDEFAGGSGNELDRGRLEKDLGELGEATKAVETFTNERVAHISYEDNLSDLKFGELDTAIHAVGELAKKYYRLRHPAQRFWYITPTVPPRWLAAFQHPWWTPDFQSVQEVDLG